MSLDTANNGQEYVCKICGKKFRVWYPGYAYHRPKRHASGEDRFCIWSCMRKADQLRSAGIEYPYETEFGKKGKAGGGRIYLKHRTICGLCKYFHISLGRLSTEVGMNKQYISYNGSKRNTVPVEVAERVADYFGIKLEDVATQEAPPPIERRLRA